MIIYLTKSKLFTIEPAKRFSKEFNVDDKLWLNIWCRYKLQGYTVPELAEYVQIKTGRKPSQKSIRRWIVRTEIYSTARHLMKLGAESVVSSSFGKYEEDVIYEITRGMRFSGTADSKSII